MGIKPKKISKNLVYFGLRLSRKAEKCGIKLKQNMYVVFYGIYGKKWYLWK